MMSDALSPEEALNFAKVVAERNGWKAVTVALVDSIREADAVIRASRSRRAEEDRGVGK